MRKKVAILGSGPAGLLAAWAAYRLGWDPVVYSLGEKSEMFGAMYLHRSIPGITAVGHFEINVIKVGSKYGYAYNTYGDPHHPVSWDLFPSDKVGAYDLKDAYDKLWEKNGIEWEHIPVKVNADLLGHICHNFPLVLCSIPAPVLCDHHDEGGHTFESQDIRVLHGADGDGMIPGVNDENLMYYNGIPNNGMQFDTDGRVVDFKGMIGHDWYRYSQIKGYKAWEYGAAVPTRPVDDTFVFNLSYGTKPISTDCDCWLRWPSFRRIGRFGKWQKGVLTHHAYEEAERALLQM